MSIYFSVVTVLKSPFETWEEEKAGELKPVCNLSSDFPCSIVPEENNTGYTSTDALKYS